MERSGWISTLAAGQWPTTPTGKALHRARPCSVHRPCKALPPSSRAMIGSKLPRLSHIRRKRRPGMSSISRAARLPAQASKTVITSWGEISRSRTRWRRRAAAPEISAGAST